MIGDTMSDSDLYPLEELAQDFVDRLRRGETPSLAEFIERCPEHADEIRDLFPALRVMENVGAGHQPEWARIADPGHELTVPFDIGDYHVLREVARGGMGIVYEAEQQALGRKVALKILSRSAARKPTSLIRFQREARSAGRLHHTNIVPVHAIGCERGIHFYTMQLIEGESLDQVMAELIRLRQAAASSMEAEGIRHTRASSEDSTPFKIANSLLTREFPDSGTDSSAGKAGAANAAPLVAKGKRQRTSGVFGDGGNRSTPLLIRNVARIGLQVAEALAYAHGQKILHRDVKPSNLLLDVHGNVWVTDFGLARDDDQALTATGELVGTLRYMPPERFRGLVDARGDVYSLGLTLYELLTLHSCLPRLDRIADLRLDAPRALPSPRQCDPSIPPDLETIVLKAMEHDPRQRYARAEDLAEDLRRFLADRPILARPFTRLERTWMWVRRNPRESTWLASLAVAMMVLTAGALFTYFLRDERDRARQAEQAALTAEQAATRAEREAQIRGLLSQAEEEGRQADRPGARGRALARIRQAATFHPTGTLRHELQRVALTALATQDFRIEQQPGKFDFAGNSFAFDLRHRYLANMTTDEVIVLRRAADYSEIRRIPAQGFPASAYLRFSENARFLAAHAHEDMDGGRVAVWNVNDGSQVFISSEEECRGFDLSRDERWLSLCQPDQRIDLINLGHPQVVRSITDLDQTATRALFSPEGGRLLVGYGISNKRAEVFDMKSLRRSLIPQRWPESALTLAWHPDGKRVAIAAWSEVEIWDVTERQLLHRLIGHRQPVDELEFHPTAPLLRTFSWDGMSRLWDTTTGRLLATFVGLVSNGSWRRDGQVLGCSFAMDHVDYVRQEPMDVFHPLQAMPDDPSFLYTTTSAGIGPLSGRLVVGFNAHDVVLCDSRTGGTLAHIRPNSPCMATIGRQGDCLWVASHEGLTRLPIRTAHGALVVGPPDLQSHANSWLRPEISANGDVFVATSENPNRLEVWDLRQWETAEKAPLLRRFAIPLPTYHDILAVSPDGHWCATTFWHDDQVLVWDLTRGTLARELVCGKQTFLAFSSDSRYLVTSRWDVFQAYEVDSWRPAFTIPRVNCSLPGKIAFSHDGRVIAAETEPSIVDLLEFTTREPLLRLELQTRPNQIYSLKFSPDDTQLHMATLEPSVLSFWNMPMIRQKLAELGLEWDHRLDALVDGVPSLENAPATGDLKLRLEGVESWQEPLSIARMNVEQARRAIATAKHAYTNNPDSVAATEQLARLLLLAPAEARNPAEALELAQAAAKRSPSDPSVANTLALAQFRTGNVDLAVDTIQANIRRQADASLPFALYVLALSLHSQGHFEEAQSYLDLADRADTSISYSLREYSADLEALAEEVHAAFAVAGG